MGSRCLLLLLLVRGAQGTTCYGADCPAGEDCTLGWRDGSDAACGAGYYCEVGCVDATPASCEGYGLGEGSHSTCEADGKTADCAFSCDLCEAPPPPCADADQPLPGSPADCATLISVGIFNCDSILASYGPVCLLTCNQCSDTPPGTCTACAAGRYQAAATLNRLELGCVACAKGQYADETGLAACKACAAGQVTTTEGLTACAPCDAGTEPSVGLDECTPCAAGTFGTDGLSCAACAAGTVSVAPGATSCATCDAGSQPSAGFDACDTCEAGTYSATGTTCDACPAGRTTGTTTGASTVEEGCPECPSGTYSEAEGSASCTDCPETHFTSDAALADWSARTSLETACTIYNTCCPSGDSSCYCDAGSFCRTEKECVDDASVDCAGYIAAEGPWFCDTDTVPETSTLYRDVCHLSCDSCPLPDREDVSDCELCPPGKHRTGLLDTDLMSFAGGADGCTPCPAGKYADAEGLAECKSCVAGRYQNPDASGASTLEDGCLSCPVGTYSDTGGAVQCTSFSCPAGSAAAATTAGGQTDPLAACEDCSPGYYAPDSGHNFCTSALPATYVSASTATGVEACNPAIAEYQNEHSATSCKTCAVGQLASPDATECISCSPGKYGTATGEVCVASTGDATHCDLTHGNDGTGSCATSTAGEAVPEGCTASTGDAGHCELVTGACEISTSGAAADATCQYVAPVDAATCVYVGNLPACTPCAPGYYKLESGDSSTACDPAPAGTYVSSANWGDEPRACAPGTYTSAEGQTECNTCSQGSMPTEGQEGCEACAAGKFGSDGSACLPCPIGQYSAAESPACIACGENEQPNTATTPNGAESPEVVEACTASTEDATDCTLTSANPDANPPVAGSCDVSATGAAKSPPATCSYVALADAVAGCEQCAAGWTSVAGSLCEECPEHQVSVSGGACQSCNAGSEPRGSPAVCVECEVGRASPVGISCSACDVGLVSLATGQTSCESCPEGKQVNQQAGTCEDCPAGRANSDGGACEACEPGLFAASPGVAQCDPAPEGHYVSASGATASTQCPSGLYQSLPGQSACVTCELGSEPNTDATGCGQCAEGTATSWRETLCASFVGVPAPDATTFSAGDVASLCCPAHCGEDAACCASSVEDLEVLPCTMGSTAPCTLSLESMAHECEDCTPGYYQNALGQHACIPAPPGHIVPGTGATEAVPCAFGSVQPERGQSICSECSPGTMPDTSIRPDLPECQDSSATFIDTAEGKILSCEITVVVHTGARANEIRWAVDDGTPTGVTYRNNRVYSQALTVPTGTHRLVLSDYANDGWGDSWLEVCDSDGTAADDSCAGSSPGSLIRVGGTDGQQTVHPVCNNHRETSANEHCDSYTSWFDPAGTTDCYSTGVGCEPQAEERTFTVQCVTPVACSPPTSCTFCPAGKMGATGDSCTDCTAGMFTSVSGQASCNRAPVGKFVAEAGAVEAVPCQAGEYSDVVGATECTLCEEGRSNTEDHRRCTDCPTGKFASAGLCVDCSPGFFTRTTRAAECTSVSPGYYVDTHGASEETPCPPGTYSFRTGSEAIECTLCEIGRYQPEAGATSCIEADAGYAVDLTGLLQQTRCRNEDGFYSASVGSSECQQCVLGQRATLDGQGCEDCPPGSYGMIDPDTGAVQCQPCGIGDNSYQPQAGQTSCLHCRAGSKVIATVSHQTVSGCTCSVGKHSVARPTCVQQQVNGCPIYACDSDVHPDVLQKGYLPWESWCFADETSGPCAASNAEAKAATIPALWDTCVPSGASDCELCPPDTYSPGGSECLPCPEGMYSPAAGSTSCIGPPPGTRLAPATVKSEISLNYDMSAVGEEGSAERRSFINEFETQVAVFVGIPVDNVQVLSIRAGSAIVEFTLQPTSDNDGDRTAAELVMLIDDGYHDPTSSLHDPDTLLSTMQAPLVITESLGRMVLPCPNGTRREDGASACEPCEAGYEPALNKTACTRCPAETASLEGRECVPCGASGSKWASALGSVEQLPSAGGFTTYGLTGQQYCQNEKVSLYWLPIVAAVAIVLASVVLVCFFHWRLHLCCYVIPTVIPPKHVHYKLIDPENESHRHRYHKNKHRHHHHDSHSDSDIDDEEAQLIPIHDLPQHKFIAMLEAGEIHAENCRVCISKSQGQKEEHFVKVTNIAEYVQHLHNQPNNREARKSDQPKNNRKEHHKEHRKEHRKEHGRRHQHKP